MRHGDMSHRFCPSMKTSTASIALPPGPATVTTSVPIVSRVRKYTPPRRTAKTASAINSGVRRMDEGGGGLECAGDVRIGGGWFGELRGRGGGVRWLCGADGGATTCVGA